MALRRKASADTSYTAKLLSQGVISLPPGSDGTPSAAPVTFGGYSADRVFTQDTLCEF